MRGGDESKSFTEIEKKDQSITHICGGWPASQRESRLTFQLENKIEMLNVISFQFSRFKKTELINVKIAKSRDNYICYLEISTRVHS